MKPPEEPTHNDDGALEEGHPLSPLEYRAAVTLNDMLVGMLETMMAAQRLERLPGSMHSAVDYLALEVAKLQGITEWVSEGLVVLAKEEDPNGD